jgi:tetratricopeptide (TPR) repeat protein
MSLKLIHGIALIIPVFALLGCNSGFTPPIKSEVKQAADLIEQKQFDKAQEMLNAVLANDPADAKANYYAALAYFGKRQYQEALDKLNVSLEKDPTFAPAYSQRALVQTRLNDNPAAMADINQAINLAPTVGKNYHRRAIILLNSKEWKRALADLEKAHQLDPKDSPYYMHMNRAEAYLGLKDYKNALRDYNEAVALAPADNHEAYLRRALCRARSGDFKGAQTDLSNFLAKHPKDPIAHALQGALYSIDGQRAKALGEYRLAISGDPVLISDMVDLGADTHTTVTDLVDVCLQKKKPELATAILTRVESHRPLEPQEQFRLAMANLQMNRTERALSLLNSCIAMAPEYIDPRVELIRYYAQQGLSQKALEMQREALMVARTQADRREVSAAIFPRR